jgi:hypothetical protein
VTRKRLLTLLAAVLLLVAAIDFQQRVYVPREYKARGEGSMVPAAVPVPRPATQIQKDLSAWLPQLRPVAAGTGTGAAAQTDWALTLLAVFSDRDRSFAVVRATSASGGAAKIQSFAMGDTVYGLTVSRIEPLKLVLTGERGEQELQLFKPSAVSAVGSGPSAESSALPPASATVATSQGGSPPAQAQAPGPAAPSQGGTKSAASQVWKPGAPVQLPASMQGLKVVDEPSTISPPEIQKGRKVKRPSKVPRNP